MPASRLLRAGILACCLLAGSLLGGCSAGGTGAPRAPSEVTLTNRTDRAVSIIAFEEEASQVIDPLPALPAEEFEARKVDVGASKRLEEIPEYEAGDGLFVLAYAKCSCERDSQVIEQWGPDAAPMVHTLRLSAAELAARGYQVDLETLNRVE